MTGTEEYYRRRAPTYDEVYERPARQSDIAEVGDRITRALAGRHVLEVAAGTGWWTAVYCDEAASVTATDFNEATLDIARRRRAWPPTVSFARADAMCPVDDPCGLRGAVGTRGGAFDGALVGFFWSHVPLAALDGFLRNLAEVTERPSRSVIVDNRFVPDSNTPLVGTDGGGNTYQHRRLSDGSDWEILKNFPTPEEVAARLEAVGGEAVVEELEHYWIAYWDLR